MAKPATTATKDKAQATTQTPGPAPAANIVPAAAPAPEVRGGLTVQGFIDSVFDEDRTKQVIASLGDSLSFAKFRASVATAIMNNPDLLKCPPALVFREVARVAALGLVFDHHLGEAYLIVGWNNKTKAKDTPQCRVGYRGLMKLARNESNVMIYAHEVHEKDEFECVLGLEKTLLHKPKVFSERGPVIGYYAVAKFRDDDDADFEPMSNAEVLAIRDRTETWKAYTAKKITFGGPWQTDEIEMGKKTVIRRLSKRLPLGPKMNAAIAIEDRAEGVIPANEPPAPRVVTPAAEQLDRFAGDPKPATMTEKVGAKVTDVQDQSGAQGEEGGQQEGEGERGDTGGEAATVTTNEAYVESEEQQPATEAKSGAATEAKSGAALLALAPEIPEDVAKEWLLKSEWMGGWKWINGALPNIADKEVRQAVVDEHAIMLRAVMAKSAGYKGAAERFLAGHGVALKPDLGGGK